MRDDCAKQSDCPVSPNRILLALLQPLLALLIVAGAAQAQPCLIEEERLWTVASSLEAARTWSERTDKPIAALQPSAAQADDHDYGSLIPLPETWPVLDEARLIENGRAAYPTAPPSHRPCAAPSTGPPSV